MKPSVGVGISATIALLGSIATLFIGVSTFLVDSPAGTPENQPVYMRYIVFFSGILFVSFAAWGIASGVGLFRRKEWARLSVIVFAVILVVTAVPGLISFLLMPTPTIPHDTDPDLSKVLFVSMHIFTALSFGILISVSIFWLWFFTKRDIRELFRGAQTVGDELSHASGRPISISIIGWYSLITACFFPLMLWLHFPVYLFGFIAKGLSAICILLAICAFQIGIGIGLLKLRASARILSIVYFAILIISTLAGVLIPGSQARFDAAKAEMMMNMGAPSKAIEGTPSAVHSTKWSALAYTLPIFGVQLWLLIKNKEAFKAASLQSESSN